MKLSEKHIELLRMVADPKCQFSTDSGDADMLCLKEAGLVSSIVSQRINWKITEKGQDELKRHTPVGICNVCRGLQRRMEGGMMVICENRHVGQRGKTPCSICFRLNTSSLDLFCEKDHTIDPPPEPRCADWCYIGADIGRRVIWGLYDL